MAVKTYFAILVINLLNMINSIKILLFIMLVSLTSCKTSSKMAKKLQSYKTSIIGCWQHSFEEDTKSNQMYYTCGTKEFKASRFRNKFIFNNDMTCSWLQLSPVDAHYMENGTYTIINKENGMLNILIYKKGNKISQLTINSINGNTMAVKSLHNF